LNYEIKSSNETTATNWSSSGFKDESVIERIPTCRLRASLSRTEELKWFCHWTNSQLLSTCVRLLNESFLRSQSLDQSIEVESAIKPLSVTIYAPSVIKQRHTNTKWSDLYNRSMASMCSVIEQVHRSNLSSIRAFCYRMRAYKYELLIESIVAISETFFFWHPSFQTEMPTILDRKLSQNRKKQSGVSLLCRIDSMFGRFFASSKSENKKNEKLVSSELYVVRNKKTMSLTYDRFFNGCSRVGSSSIHLLP